MNDKKMVPLEWSNQRVMLSAQVAKAFECSVDRIRDNFNANKDQYVEGIHYFVLEGATLQNLRVGNPDLQISPKTRKLYLWTERGVVRHCKSINTQKAWDKFDELERVYFFVKNAAQPSLFTDTAPVAKNKYRPLPEFAVVYILKMDNITTKIGLTSEFNRRVEEVRKKNKSDILDWYTTPMMTFDEAKRLEKSLKARFSSDSLGNEFFATPFEIVRRLLTEDPAAKLLNIADRIQDPVAKDTLLMEIANITAGKDIF